MSQDLLEAFGYGKRQELERNPWTEEWIQKDIAGHLETESNEFGAFEVPAEHSTPYLTAHSIQVPNENDATHSGKSTSTHEEDAEWGDFINQSEETHADTDETQAVNPLISQFRASGTTVESSKVPTNSSLRTDVGSRPVGSNLETPNVNTTTASSEQKPPPTNIPPPSILLSLTATLFHS